MSEPHGGNSIMNMSMMCLRRLCNCESHIHNVNTRNINVSEPHPRNTVGKPHTRNINVSEHHFRG